jgi:DNA mismatch repair ATPase MutL
MHAAQERIKYEYFRDKIGEVTNEVQDLLIPLTFHFSKDEQLVIYLENIHILFFLELHAGQSCTCQIHFEQ